MKTTVDIPDVLLKEVKVFASRRNLSMKQVIEMALRQMMKPQNQGNKPFHLRRHSFRGQGLHEGVSEGDWNSIREMIYRDRGG